jgi:hypothetical protein
MAEVTPSVMRNGFCRNVNGFLTFTRSRHLVDSPNLIS